MMQPGQVQEVIATCLTAQPNGLGLTFDEANRIAAWLADHRGLPPQFALVRVDVDPIDEAGMVLRHMLAEQSQDP